jgi:GTP cyclohydrolase I
VNLEQKYQTAAKVRGILEEHKIPYYANHNIFEAIATAAEQYSLSTDSVRNLLVDELTKAFEEVLYVLSIDTKRDPNSIDTPRRLAKMYIHELMEGRYYPEPKVTSFPNDKPQPAESPSCSSTPNDTEIYHFNNLLVVQSPYISTCSHHHQQTRGTAYIGIIPGKKLIGLSKYTRVVRHIAARGSLQEELCVDIAASIQEHTETDSVAVVVYSRHGCCENRGIGVSNSQTVTAEMRGLFMSNASLRSEFYSNVQNLRNESIH